MEEQVRGVLVERDVADFINDEQAVTAESGQFGGEFAAGVSVLEAADPAGRGVEVSSPGFCGGSVRPVPSR